MPNKKRKLDSLKLQMDRVLFFKILSLFGKNVGYILLKSDFLSKNI